MAIDINQILQMARFKQQREQLQYNRQRQLEKDKTAQQSILRDRAKEAQLSQYHRDNSPYLNSIAGQTTGKGGANRAEMLSDQANFLADYPAPQGYDTKRYSQLIKDRTATPGGGSSPFFREVGLGDRTRLYTSPTEYTEVAKGASPSSGNYSGVPQFVGRTPDGKSGIIWDPKVGEFRTESLPSEKVIPKTDKFASATESKELAGLEQLRGELDFIEEKYQPEYVGLIDGLVGAASSYFEGGDEAVFRRSISSMGDTLLRLKSGAQINEQEFARLMQIIPNFKMGDKQFLANLGDFRRELSNTLKTRKAEMKKAGIVTKDGAIDFSTMSDEDLLGGF